MQTDVLIIGSGLAGMAAAYEASRAGADVMIVEKMPYPGGNSALAGGGFAAYDCNLHLREKLGGEDDSAEIHADDTIRSGKGGCIEPLVRIMTENGPDAMNWMLDCGVPFKEIMVKGGGHSAARVYQTSVTGKQMMDAVRAAVLKTGVRLLLNCRVTGFIPGGDADNRAVIGVKCELDGSETEIYAKKSIILASGGFAADVPFRRRFNPALDENYNCSNHKGATGEVLQMAMEIGADTLNMPFVQLFPSANPKSGAVDMWALRSYDCPGFGGIFVTSEGNRFVNELEGRDVVSDAQIKNTTRNTWAIIGKAQADIMKMTEDNIKTGIRLGRMFRGETIEDLCAQIGADADRLSDEISQHNDFIVLKTADRFNMPWSPLLQPMTEGPFYAIAQWPSVHFTMGGLSTDEKCRVLDVDGNPISGLYAAGEVCGGVHGKNRLGGNALTECVVFGKIAGEEASR